MNDEELILDRYRLLERLAAGGSAEVWRARDEQLGREVAVKRLHPHLLPDDASRKRLVAEARAAAALSHPVVVGIYDIDATGESPALVMELVDGESLAARIARDGPLPPDDAVGVVADLADALFHAHQRGVIHRDVKPGNVLLTSDGRTRLVDFGIAHSLAAGTERLTLTGTVIGTLHAMAPEQLADGPITPRTDLYGLGVVLHESLTGRPPYAAGSPVALADAQRGGALDLRGIEPALAALVAGCLAFDPTDRPLHAGALAGALRSWLAGDPGPALAMAPGMGSSAPTLPRAAVAGAGALAVGGAAGAAGATGAGAAAAAGPQAPAPARATGADAGGQRTGWLGPAAALVALLVLGGVAFAMLGGDPNAGADSTATPSPSVIATATPAEPTTAEWLPALVEEVAEVCGGERAAEFAGEFATARENEARREARDLIRECGDQGDDD